MTENDESRVVEVAAASPVGFIHPLTLVKKGSTPVTAPE